jgi:hypothetical protein
MLEVKLIATVISIVLLRSFLLSCTHSLCIPPDCSAVHCTALKTDGLTNKLTSLLLTPFIGTSPIAKALESSWVNSVFLVNRSISPTFWMAWRAWTSRGTRPDRTLLSWQYWQTTDGPDRQTDGHTYVYDLPCISLSACSLFSRKASLNVSSQKIPV